MPRWCVLPDRGLLLVSTDLHGNGADFRRLRDQFRALCLEGGPVYWVLLGDTVHAPSDEARQRCPDLYDFADESLPIVEGVLELMEQHPGQVLYVLGNHDLGHVGGPHTHKFYPDEVLELESRIGPAGAVRLRQLFEPALLAVLAPCGVLLCHGSPDDRLASLNDLDAVTIPPTVGDPYSAHLLDSFLNSYGQRAEVTSRLLDRLSQGAFPVPMVIHGHDRDESGYFTEGGNQVCPVIFGAPRPNKRYLLLDLSDQYPEVSALREGKEIRRLYAD